MNTKTLSEIDAKRVSLFTDLLTIGVEPEYLKQVLTRIYIRYTRLLLNSRDSDSAAMNIGKDTDMELYYLSELIEVLAGGYEY
ncbi:hypothetical protein [Mucilaginibacter sp.]|uniref:hypothetical protein n=1 Tax=Mucilaginibacter sp. TaxID=1882438 RepID=UPI0026377A37|nr:hypothetical protein [Mucilaginibacter sp.]MDB5029719.1 hypothetical protein [Mucilaginibacter sp.]